MKEIGRKWYCVEVHYAGTEADRDRRNLWRRRGKLGERERQTDGVRSRERF